jgi:hypothetical protein
MIHKNVRYVARLFTNAWSSYFHRFVLIVAQICVVSSSIPCEDYGQKNSFDGEKKYATSVSIAFKNIIIVRKISMVSRPAFLVQSVETKNILMMGRVEFEQALIHTKPTGREK